MKRCSRCGLTKPYSEFHKYDRGDGYQPWCKPCRKAYDHAYWEQNKKRWADQKQAWAEKRREWLRDLKSGKTCTDCGGTFPPEALQWDHLPGTVKVGAISRNIQNWRPTLVLEEIAKCELVCASCHAVRTYRRHRESRNNGV